MAQIGYIGQLRPPARKYTAQETTQVSCQANPFFSLKAQNRRSRRSKEQVFQLTKKPNIAAARGVAVERERLPTDRLACRSIERSNRSAMIVFSNFVIFFLIRFRPDVNGSKYRSARWPAGKQTLASLYSTDNDGQVPVR